MTSLSDTHVRFLALAECTSDAVFITDFDSARFVEVNAQATELLGYTREELCRMTGRHLHPPEDGDLVTEMGRELVQRGSVFRPAVRLQHKSGSHLWAELRSRAYEAEGRKLYVTFVRDVSATIVREQELSDAYQTLNEAELQLLHTSRLAALGQLATGIAHEVNNPAATLLSCQEALLEDLAQVRSIVVDGTCPAPTHHSLEDLITNAQSAVKDSLESIHRIASVVNNLRGYAAIDAQAISQVDVNDVVHVALSLARPELKAVRSVRVSLRAHRTLPADHSKLGQVVVNLLLNAAYAVRNTRDSELLVETEDNGGGIVIRVSDNGEGIPLSLRSRVFDPFFTTKPASVGTGLGLSVATDIVTKHRGHLSLADSVLGGSSFEVYIPCDTGFSFRPTAPTKELPARTCRVLIVDDEPTLVRAYRRLLSKSHQVVGAFGGDEALAILARDDDFDLILCDLMMPRVDGAAVYRHLLRWQPHLVPQLLFCTGGPTTPECRQFLAETQVDVVIKPVTQEVLLEWVRRKAIHRQQQTP
jgi:two-component system NtrC family sensor kinase